MIVHENFHSGALYNDYAILILKDPVEYAENVDIVCLADTNMNFDGSQCLASGWGKDVFGKEESAKFREEIRKERRNTLLSDTRSRSFACFLSQLRRITLKVAEVRGCTYPDYARFDRRQGGPLPSDPEEGRTPRGAP